ncbi:meiosis-specific coiled-coil domain-containing protein MEIOC [Acanthochromis polyacanthus]|uniref:meiosis-specific coiled-coil domain-containing protein MEIOC n=1 Tax=Acanthochromis polyacanthus TaxID=80966 RepID=UPI002234003C|nr:meiosis-specific coiled-coil domain-containing protein MEIOC [Acanthochromis polyacanthus]
MSAYNDRGLGQPVNNFLNLSDIFRPQNEMSSTSFDPFYEDHSIQSSVKPICNEQYVPEDINQLVSSFQSFMADSVCRGDFPNMHKQALGMHSEDSLVEEWKTTSPSMSTQSTPAMQIPKQLVGEFGTVQRERSEGVRKQIFKRHAFQDLPDFTSQNPECFQQSKQFSATLNFPNQYQNKMTMHRENINVSMNQYSNHHIQQSQIQNKIKPQMQKEKKRLHMSGLQGEVFSWRPQTNAHVREGDKQHFSQSPYFDFQGSMQSQRFDGGNSMFSGGNAQQVMPFMYPVNDLRRQSNMSINSNFRSRSTLPYGSGVPGANVDNVMSANESPAFKSYVGDIRTRRGERTPHVPASAMMTSVMMNQGGPAIQPCFYLDECYEQWRRLEKERKKIEAILKKTFFGKRPAAVTNINLPKTPPNPTRIDHLIVNQTREQAKVESLLERMECLCSTPLHSNIHTALKRHHMAICITQARCMEDTANMTKYLRQKPHFTEDRDDTAKACQDAEPPCYQGGHMQ